MLATELAWPYSMSSAASSSVVMFNSRLPLPRCSGRGQVCDDLRGFGLRQLVDVDLSDFVEDHRLLDLLRIPARGDAVLDDLALPRRDRPDGTRLGDDRGIRVLEPALHVLAFDDP